MMSMCDHYEGLLRGDDATIEQFHGDNMQLKIFMPRKIGSCGFAASAKAMGRGDMKEPVEVKCNFFSFFSLL